MLKPCTPAGAVRRKHVLARCCRTGFRPSADTAMSPPLFSCGSAASLVVRAACSTCDRYCFQSATHPVSFLPLFQASRHCAVAIGFRHSRGVCLHLLPWGVLSHFSSFCAVMGLELGFYTHCGICHLVAVRPFPRHVTFLRLRLCLVVSVLPFCSWC